ncbi:MAG: SMEK domain-containing protein [Methylococcaceae bacterium]
MNRSEYFNYISRELSALATRINERGALNILDYNIHAENFYLHFFNLLFDWNLININSTQQNAAGIDLVDTTNNIIIQVSATATKQKIESALNKKDISNYPGYSFKFISISKDTKELRTKTFTNPYNLTFSPASDIFDITSLEYYCLFAYRSAKKHL